VSIEEGAVSNCVSTYRGRVRAAYSETTTTFSGPRTSCFTVVRDHRVVDVCHSVARIKQSGTKFSVNSKVRGEETQWTFFF